MSNLTKQFHRIDNWLENNQSGYAEGTKEYLQKGLDREQLNDAIKGLPFHLPREIYELYEWHNGYFEVGYLSDQAVYFGEIDEYIWLINKRYYQLTSSPYFPFISFGKHGTYAVKGEDYSQDCSPVYFFNNDMGNSGRVVSPNIANIFRAIAECLETYNFISASHASLNNKKWFVTCHKNPKNAMKILNELNAKHRPLFYKIYSKYGVEDIWY